MSISAKVICDSINNQGVRITTFELRYPRWIHAEFLTHRVFSRSSSSSRAIPTKKVIADIRNDPAMPVHWGKNRPGMQATEEVTGWRLKLLKGTWLAGMYIMTSVAKVADKLGAHKQIVNRLIEPWSHIKVVVTSTQWSNFFALRAHPDAQPEIRELAIAMKAAHDASKPKFLGSGEWHLPYVEDHDIVNAERIAALGELNKVNLAGIREKMSLRKRYGMTDAMLILIGISVARCARTSYTLHDGSATTFEKDFDLYVRLLGQSPIHASPAEHQATPDKAGGKLSGNFDSSWAQYRKMLSNECL